MALLPPDWSRLDEEQRRPDSVLLHPPELLCNDHVNNYSPATRFYGRWKIKLKFSFCPLVNVVSTKCTQSLLINSLISP